MKSGADQSVMSHHEHCDTRDPIIRTKPCNCPPGWPRAGAVEYAANGPLYRLLFWLARHGWFRYDGLQGMHPRPMPMARVYYPDSDAYSVEMPLGNAIDYAEIFNGKVVRRV